MEKLVQFINNIMSVGQDKAVEIASHFTPGSYKKGELLLRQGQVSNEYLFLESGCIRSYLYDLEGNEVTMNFYGPLQPCLKWPPSSSACPAKGTWKPLPTHREG